MFYHKHHFVQDNSGAVLTTQGAPSSEYFVTVGGVQATIASVFASNLFFFPPLPEPADSIFDKNGAKEILVSIHYFLPGLWIYRLVNEPFL